MRWFLIPSARLRFFFQNALSWLRASTTTPPRGLTCCISSLVQAGAAVPSRPTAAAEGSFVVESIVRSKGSLNEITIVEGQEFIGEESGETPAPEVPQCSAAGGSPVSLFGGAVHGSLFDDCGDSSDYFCGVSRRGRPRRGRGSRFSELQCVVVWCPLKAGELESFLLSTIFFYDP